MSRLLVISCSQSKSRDGGLLPAINRYDGPAFRVLRKYLRESPDPSLKILVLSAKFGLIEDKQAIPDYDCRLSRESALAMRSIVSAQARHLIDAKRWSRIGLCAGNAYRVALQELLLSAQRDIRLDLIGGGLGTRLSRLKAWLRDPDPISLFMAANRVEERPEHGSTHLASTQRRRKEAL